MTRPAILLPISGLFGGVVRSLYNECERKLQAEFPNHKILCIGTPFPKAPFPLLAGTTYRDRLPQEQVIRSWSHMVGFGIAKLKPALEQADVVITRRLGLDIPLLASECKDWDANKDAAMRIHFSMVANILVKEFGIQIPDAYILPKGENGTMKTLLTETFPELKKLPAKTVEAFLDRQRGVLDWYFDPSTGQHPPFVVDATKSMDEMFTAVVGFVRWELERPK